MPVRAAGTPHAAAVAGLAALALGGCQMTAAKTTPDASVKVVAAPSPQERDCLTRAMYFEANRSDDDGLLAVGTVVMNRLDSRDFPDSICGIVGQKRQFAEGVMTKPMKPSERERVEAVADALLAGKRHEKVAAALHFHVGGRTYRFPRMHYLIAAGGNRFYEKTDRAGNRPEKDPSAVVETPRGLVPVRVAFAAMASDTQGE